MHLRGLLGKFQRVSPEIGELDHFIALVMMPQDRDVLAEFALRRGNAFVQRVVGHRKVRVEIAADSLFNARGSPCIRLVRSRERMVGDRRKACHRHVLRLEYSSCFCFR